VEGHLLTCGFYTGKRSICRNSLNFHLLNNYYGGGGDGAYKILIGKPERKRSLERP
jgi:hypothetical protein